MAGDPGCEGEGGVRALPGATLLLGPNTAQTIRVMAGQKREARLRADVPAIHVFRLHKKSDGCPAKAGHDG